MTSKLYYKVNKSFFLQFFGILIIKKEDKNVKKMNVYNVEFVEENS